ncbi:MAG: molecular chaperone HtpG [Eubacteriales bacterium]|nr:molecular chaperone HtpG [Eubacteriales bacterium]
MTVDHSSKRSGEISVEARHIFPIIRKWLYSDEDIFVRELVSNASDAIRKYEQLIQISEAEEEGFEPKIELIFDAEKKRLSFCDNGIGMTAEELDLYINHVAFSGALDFVQKYEEKGQVGEGIIGHFGLGFYSAFMVSKRVEILTRSYRSDAELLRWQSEDGIDFEIESLRDADLDLPFASHGTCISLELDEEHQDSINASMLRQTLAKYCSFMKDPIFFKDLEAEKRDAEHRASKRKSAEEKRLAASDEADIKAAEEELQRLETESAQPALPINEEPLWLRRPQELEDEDYIRFYHRCFHDFEDPLFWIHLNMDYPMRLKGILYFPKRKERLETFDGRIKLYYNQVFVADQLKDLIPDFLFLLQGCLDCPDLPLNVSRSFLQNDQQLKTLSEHIERKVADRLKRLQSDDAERYSTVFNDIKVFLRYGCLSSEKFLTRVKEALLFETMSGDYLTLSELGEKVFYSDAPDQQFAYIRQHERAGETVIRMDQEIDLPFMQRLMYDSKGELKFLRVDAELPGEASSEQELEALQTALRKAFGSENLELQLRPLSREELPAFILEDEETRAFKEMQKRYQMPGLPQLPDKESLLLNSDHPLVQRFERLAADDSTQREELERLAKLLERFARFAHASISPEDLHNFIKDLSYQI